MFSGIPDNTGYSDDSEDWKDKLDQAINKLQNEKLEEKRHKKNEKTPIKVAVEVPLRAHTSLKKPENSNKIQLPPLVVAPLAHKLPWDSFEVRK